MNPVPTSLLPQTDRARTHARWVWGLGKMHYACSKSKIRKQTPPDLLDCCISVKTQGFFSLNPAGTSNSNLHISALRLGNLMGSQKGCSGLHSYKTTHIGSLCLPTALQNTSTSLPSLCKHLSESAWTHGHGSKNRTTGIFIAAAAHP